METPQLSHLAGSGEGAEGVYTCLPQAFAKNNKTQAAGYYLIKHQSASSVLKICHIQYLHLKEISCFSKAKCDIV